MEKISRIIPANARTKAVDVSNSQPVRPGAPGYGRPMGRVTRAPLEIEDRVSLSTAEKAITQQPANYRDRVEARRAQIAERMAEKFFGNPAVESSVVNTAPAAPTVSEHALSERLTEEASSKFEET